MSEPHEFGTIRKISGTKTYELTVGPHRHVLAESAFYGILKSGTGIEFGSKEARANLRQHRERKAREQNP